MNNAKVIWTNSNDIIFLFDDIVAIVKKIENEIKVGNTKNGCNRVTRNY